MKKATTTMKKTKSGVEEGKEETRSARVSDPAAQRSDARIKEPSDWRGETLARIRMLIKQADPEVVEEVKWRKPFELDGRGSGVVARRNDLHR